VPPSSSRIATSRAPRTLAVQPIDVRVAIGWISNPRPNSEVYSLWCCRL